MGRGAPPRHSRHSSLCGMSRQERESCPTLCVSCLLSRTLFHISIHDRVRFRFRLLSDVLLVWLKGRRGTPARPRAFGPLVPLGSTSRNAHTCGLSTSSSATALQGGLISGRASRLDALSAYPVRTRLPGCAPGGTTGTPLVRPTRSSRTKVRPPQASNARNR